MPVNKGRVNKRVVLRCLDLPLPAFGAEGLILEVAVPWLDTPLYFVSDEAAADELTAEGVDRGRIWTAAELETLLAQHPSQAQVRAVAETKRILQGDLLTPPPEF